MTHDSKHCSLCAALVFVFKAHAFSLSVNQPVFVTPDKGIAARLRLASQSLVLVMQVSRWNDDGDALARSRLTDLHSGHYGDAPAARLPASLYNHGHI